MVGVTSNAGAVVVAFEFHARDEYLCDRCTGDRLVSWKYLSVRAFLPVGIVYGCTWAPTGRFSSGRYRLRNY